jgi:DNA-binding IclR family transcriptional regulator
MNNANNVLSILKAFDLLELLSRHENGLSLTDISNHLKWNKATAHRIANTLLARGYITQNEETLKYKMSFKILSLGSRLLNETKFNEISAPFLKNLLTEINETIHLVLLDGLGVAYIDKLEPKDIPYRMNTYIGKRNPLYSTAVGKIMLAYNYMDSLDEIWAGFDLKSYTPNTITNIDQMRDELKNILKNGYAYDNEEQELDIICIASPVFNNLGTVNYAVSVSIPKSRFSSEKEQNVLKYLIKTTEEISRTLGYSPK